MAQSLLWTLQIASLLMLSPSLPATGSGGLDGASELTSTSSADCASARSHVEWPDRSFEFADLRGCDLRDADLSGSRLIGARLQGAMLDRADLRGADLRLVDFSGASLRGTDLREADLSSAEIDNAASLDGALWAGAVCPDEVVADVDAACSAGMHEAGG